MVLRNRRGFTLIEVIVVAAIIAILAGILVPMIFSQIDESKVTKAKGDCKTIANAVAVFRKDLTRWPNSDSADLSYKATNFSLLYSSGYKDDAAKKAIIDGQLTGLGYTLAPDSPFRDHLTSNDPLYPVQASASSTLPGWKGPYQTEFPPDPWNNPYITDAKGFFMTDGSGNIVEDKSTPVWVLSAGPDGVFQTGPGSTALLGDDIGVRIK